VSGAKPPDAAEDISMWPRLVKIGALVVSAIAGVAAVANNVDSICTFAEKHVVDICRSSPGDPFGSLDEMSKYLSKYLGK
jgi:hypothetical protein